ncbi:Tim44/TimA family putative adaptor protein [Hyphococcus flavus]|uniref:Tim44/TimA family putative adaptor protein n=1 Tax=Hyphococcus flavus TaxID=1866326 RepID=A0AAF0CIF5_9PROT|nr:Tim44/TimA family putative adaptor protein [Hyphococcus flavus]WDI32802.1 Tim44/TimA family putative adaptor protein [Hyphococcus flavus]
MDPVLLFFAGVTAFIIFRLISVMGTRTGHEQQHDLEGLQRASSARAAEEQRDDDSDKAEPAAPKPVSTNARVLRDADPAFDEKEFLAGARGAYEMIVEAFASGDLKSIRPYLSDSVYSSFKEAVVERDKAGHVADLKFVGIENASIVDSSADRDEMTAIIDFASNQVRVTRDKDGEVVEGDPNRIDLVKDRWKFSKKRSSRDPNWTLVGTGGSQ